MAEDVGHEGITEIPVNSWSTEHELVVEAPMPGVKPEDIEVEVREGDVEIKGLVVGDHGEAKDYIVQEWHLGPYQRTVELPYPVNAELANANFGNGVLVLRLPKAEETRSGAIRLERTGPARGRARGHAGHDVEPR